MTGCENKRESKNPEPIRIEVGKSYHRNNLTEAVLYSGMPNKETFSVSYGRTWAVNNFYPIDTKEIVVEGYKYQVISVDAKSITLKDLGKVEKK